MIIITHTFYFRSLRADHFSAIANWESSIQMAEKMNVSGAVYMKCVKFPGIGCVLYWIGLLLYLFSIGYNFVVETLLEPDEEEPEKVSEKVSEKASEKASEKSSEENNEENIEENIEEISEAEAPSTVFLN